MADSLLFMLSIRRLIPVGGGVFERLEREREAGGGGRYQDPGR